MNWTLVTGAPCADIGKGSFCAALARKLERNGNSVAYQKLEPCLQQSLADIPSGVIGEIVRLPDGQYVDFDVARVLFYAPCTTFGQKPDLSLWHSIHTYHKGKERHAPRIVGEVAAGLATYIPQGEDHLIVEVGGSLGESEHRTVLEALAHTLGRPSQHIVIGAIVREPSGRKTTKPLQLCLELSPIPPDVIFLRDAGVAELATLKTTFGERCNFFQVEESTDPVETYLSVLGVAGIRGLPDENNVKRNEDEDRSVRGVVAIYGDVLESRRYESLKLRIDSWSNGRVKLVNGHDLKESPNGVVLVGGSKLDVNVPALRISTDDADERPDWMGTCDQPDGPVAEFLKAAKASAVNEQKSAYTMAGFVSEYILRSRKGELRDHDLLDPIVWSLLPKGDELQACRVLDVGCGYGRWATRLLKKGVSEVVGVEPSPQMCSALAEQQLPGFHLLQVGIEEAPLDGVFDVALALMSLDHVVDLFCAIQRIAGHLKPGGRMIITTEHPWRTCTEGHRWRVCPTDPERRQGIVENYRDEGPRTFTWFGRGEPVVVQHRTLETWVKVVREAGLNVLSIREPASQEPRDGNVPRFWLLCAEVPCGG